ncbi:hypothetical protein L2X99_00710 [Microbacterium sp. KUDC0406]|uniref:hypothetical protein n=1 Tax=Microbacterium sp. KUDC0406 TaxID=2909588 RepID=UPI001F260206|nr:hypothetical protein [Microbacterium sp. KUDC0406]UJP10278.1 hypothetical protein L2X99_00710 [Microbacterium sp. KUDC0406]
MSTPSRRVTARSVLVVACVGLMAFGPALALAGPRPAMLGWQMYSAQPGSPIIEIVTVDGGSRLLSLSDLVPRWRPEIDYAARVPQQLCASDPGIARVEMRRDTPRMDVRVTCER